jgi:hypothetical protein
MDDIMLCKWSYKWKFCESQSELGRMIHGRTSEPNIRLQDSRQYFLTLYDHSTWNSFIKKE